MKYLKYVISFLTYILTMIEIALLVIILNVDKIKELLNMVNMSMPSILSKTNIAIVSIIVLLILILMIIVLVRKKMTNHIGISFVSASILVSIVSLFIVNMDLVRNFNFLNEEFSLAVKSVINVMCYQCVTLSLAIMIMAIIIFVNNIYKYRKST